MVKGWGPLVRVVQSTIYYIVGIKRVAYHALFGMITVVLDVPGCGLL